MAPHVRLARPEDLKHLEDLRGRAQDAWMFPRRDPDFLARTLASPMGGRLFVADDGGSVVGYAALAEAPEATCGFLEVVVERLARGRGVGGSLVEAAVATARLQKLARVEVHVTPDNGIAEPFLTGLGFRLAGPAAPGGGAVYRLDLR